MRFNLKSIFSAVAAATLIAGCATPGTEDPGTKAPVTGPGSTPQTVDTKPIARVDPTSKGIGDKGPVPPKTGSTPLAQRSIYYDLDQFDVKDQYRGLVEAHAKFLRDNPASRILIQGNTDERGSREYNVSLGQRRSDGVKKMLILLGARENQIESVSLGEEKPQADGQGESAWSKNRRSDILYGGEY
jgi:peptidoglycan-associated lipoprotein